MAGLRHEMDSIGESYEVFAESVLSRITAITRIETKKDFGTDTYCQPRIMAGTRVETVTELCLLQIKGGSSPLEYGGLKNGQWKSHEIEWLKNLWAPLYLATVDAEYQRVNLFSLWPIWEVIWQSRTPFKIVCSWREASTTPYEFTHPTKEAAAINPTHSDGQIWRIDLGPPILKLTHSELNDDDFRNHAVQLFRDWIQMDRQTVARFHAWVPFIKANYTWATNQKPNVYLEWLVFDATPGMNIEPLARTLVPSILGLGAHLQHQGNLDAFRLIPILEWVQSNGYGNTLTGGLLEKLSRASREGVSPATYL